MNRKIQISLPSSPEPWDSSRSPRKPTFFGRLKTIVAGALIAILAVGILVAALILGSAIAALVGILLLIALAAGIIKLTLQRARR